jgi:uncharacterized tellurite resistance protein B-like protein
MLDKMKSLFTEPVGEKTPPRSDALHIAAAALLVRAAQIDGVMDHNETKLLTRLVGPHFGLKADAAALLIEEAKQAANEASDLFQFTHRINTHFGETHKLMLVELLWQIVLADGVVDDYEANLLRRVAGLIHVTDLKAGQARKKAEAALGE